ncbi:transient receptor potential cation channel subfamily A member 1 homolog [Bacillus rossius redtenbacheri]|uniref:transient receptor potential cation channel subfamily A member 1 homolog n=1 Tax=Bacillus rossius redtenbacheri TaxID=93214 RepID=UPI002FDDBA9E
MKTTRSLFIIGLIFFVSVECRSIEDTQGDQEVQVPDDKPLSDLALHNFFTYLVEEKERLEDELNKLRQLVVETRGVSLTNISDLEAEFNNSVILVETWKKELKTEIANNSMKIEELTNTTLQNLFKSFMQARELEAQLNHTRQEAERLRASGELCESKVEPLRSTVEELKEKMKQLKVDVIKKLVTSYNRQRVWRSLRTGLEAVLEAGTAAHAQLQRLGYDQTGPLVAVGKSTEYNDLLALLLEHGLDPDVAADSSDWTMLHHAAYSNTVVTARLLLRHGAHTEMRNDNKRTPLVQTAWDNRLAGLKLLVDHGAYVSSADKSGRTALHYTAVYNYLEAAKYLVAHGALTAAKDSDGKTARQLGGTNSVASYLAAFEG